MLLLQVCSFLGVSPGHQDHSDHRVASPVNQARVAPQRHNEKSTLALPLLGGGAAPDVETRGATVGYVQKGNDIYTTCI